ncbi:MAG: FAD-binding oxidoreductase [Verrucomicrobiales bacterium]|nr:FAD-binding oxidoreductase [Verrucomicrobiales bacterium]
MKVDHIIVGQGLAGSLLAWHLLQRGRKVLVVDRDEAVTSSKVAAGLVTPVSGQQYSLPEGIEETLTFAKQVYWDIEEELGQQYFHHLRIARLFGGKRDIEKWAKRLSDPGQKSRYESFAEKLEIDQSLINAPFGGIEVKNGGWLNVAAFVEGIRQYLLERLAYAVGTVKSRDVQCLPNGGVQWRNITAQNIIFCEGWKGVNNHFFGRIPMNNARGDILRCRAKLPEGESRIINRNGWILPLGNGEFRGGSSYDHHYLDEYPTKKGRAEVEEKIRVILKEDFEVIDHQSAIRPIIKRSQVFMGRHPEVNDIVYFNGLGSKGVLNAPARTLALVEHLTEGKPVPRVNDIQVQFEW